MRHKEHFLSYLKRNYLNDHGYRGTLTRSLMEDPYIKCNLCNHTRTLKRLKAIGASDGCMKSISDRATDYLCYDGICWNEDIPGAHRIVHELTDLQLAEAEDAMNAAWQVLLNNGGAELVETLSAKKALASMSEDQQKAFAWYNVTEGASCCNIRSSKRSYHWGSYSC